MDYAEKTQINLQDWPDVDGVLEVMGRVDLDLALLEAEMGQELYDLVQDYASRMNELRSVREIMQAMVTSFCLARKGEFAKKRSKQLAYGKIAFRVAEKIDVPKNKEGIVIAALKSLGWSECIRVEEKVDKPALKKLPDNDLAKCGVYRRREDHFRIEPDLDLIAGQTGKDRPKPTVLMDLDKISGALKKEEAA